MRQNINNDRRQQRGRITAGDFASRKQEPAFWRIFFNKFFAADPCQFQKTGDRRLGRINTRPAFFDNAIRLRSGNIADIGQ